MKLINALGAVPYLIPSSTWNMLTIVCVLLASNFADKYVFRPIYEEGNQMVMIYELKTKYEADTGESFDDNIWSPGRCSMFWDYIHMKILLVLYQLGESLYTYYRENASHQNQVNPTEAIETAEKPGAAGLQQVFPLDKEDDRDAEEAGHGEEGRAGGGAAAAEGEGDRGEDEDCCEDDNDQRTIDG